MKKSLVLAMAMALGVTASAYAANPFSDVPAGHWAYDSIDKLAAAGVIDGMGDGTFQGNKTMTRYEMAQIVAKAMAKGANVDKLAAEFAEELDNLGVRVAKLEKKADNVMISGEFRASYRKGKADFMQDSKDIGSNHESILRSRLFLTGKINEDWTYNAMLQNEQTLTNSDAGKGEEKVEFKRAYVEGRIGGLNVTAGRQAYAWGEGNVLDDDATSDAVVLSYGSKLKVEGVVAQLSNSDDKVEGAKYAGAKLVWEPKDNLSLRAEYVKFKDIGKDGDDDGDIIPGGFEAEISNVGITYGIGDVELNAMYIHGNSNLLQGGKDGFVAGVAYKGAEAEEPGSWGLNATYYNQGGKTYAGRAGDGTFEFDNGDGFKGWSIGADYALAKNVVAAVTYYDTKAKSGSNEKDHVLWSELTFSF